MSYLLTLSEQALVESKRQFYAEYCNGGMKMVNINAFIAALKTTWLRKIITDNNSPWSIILQFMTDTKKVVNLGSHFIKNTTLNIKTSFGEMYSHLIYNHRLSS